VPDILGLAGLRKQPDAVCAGCGRELTADLVVRDVDPNGDLAVYHQRCAPSLGASVSAPRRSARP
jgi:hypothetical protein